MTRGFWRTWLPWAAMAVVAVSVLVLGAHRGGVRSNQDRINAIAATVRCPECRSETVRDSAAPAALDLRNFIATEVAKGTPDGSIRAAIEAKFPGTSLVPPSSGVGALVWVVPVVATVVAAGALAVAFRRWSRQAALTPGPSDEDRALVAEAMEHLDDEP
jgi:cytochrome c-type biogenesis protein CcmH